MHCWPSWSFHSPSRLSKSSSSSYSSSLNSSFTEPPLTLLMMELVRPDWLAWCFNPGVPRGLETIEGMSATSFLFLIRIRFLSCDGEGSWGSSL